MSSTNKPEILLLSLSYIDFFDETYASLLNRLLEVFHVKRVKNATAALRELSNSTFKVIIITDEGLTEPANREVLAKVKTYIEGGGLAIVGLHFPNFITLDRMDGFFKEFDLPWKRGDYRRTIFQFVPSSIFPTSLNLASVPEPYSMKVVHIANARTQEKIFVPTPGALTQIRVFPPGHVDESQAAVTGARIGRGDLVYCGDINGEAESTVLIMALCGF